MKKIAIGCVVSVLVFIVALAVLWHFLCERPFNQLPFDRTVWIAHINDESLTKNPRGKMAGDLRRRFLHSGMTRAQVTVLLGKPDWFESPRLYQYMLGGHSGFGMDEDTLDVYFDRSGRLRHVEIVQH